MRIKGVYILSRRSIARMLTVMSAALMLLCTPAAAKDESLIDRIHTSSIALHNLDREIAGRSTRTVVKPAKYHKCKSAYLEAKQYNKEHPPSKAECCQCPVPTANRKPDGALATFGRVPQAADPNGQDARCPSAAISNGQDARCPSAADSNGQDARCPSAAISNGQDARCPSAAISNGQDARCPSAALATKADLRAAVKTILRGEDVSASKPGPRITPAKQRQIEAAEMYRATHCGCTLHNACIKSFVFANGGYKSAKALYVVLNRKR